MPRGKVQGISGEHVARPGPGVSGQYDRVDPAAPVDGRLRPNQPGVRGRAVRVVSTGHVHFDVLEAAFRQVRLEGGECLGRGPIGDESNGEFRDSPGRENWIVT